MGRRYGKTIMAGAISLSCAAHGGAVAWVVPTYRNARPLWRFAEAQTRPIAPLLRINRSDRTIEFPGGGWLGIYTADNPVGILGEAFDLAIVEEAARVPGDVWYETIMPTLADKSGRAILISTPRGHNWFHTEYMRGLADGNYQASFTAPSSANPSPQIQRAADIARRMVSERTYRQEWLAEFVEDGAGVFVGVQDIATAEAQAQAIDGHAYVIGADWARTTDATVFVVLDTTLKAAVHIERMVGTEFARQRARLIDLWARFGRGQVIAESNSIGQAQIEALAAEGLPVTPFLTTNASKAAVIDALSLAIEQRKLTIIPDPVLVGELQAYEAERLPSGLMRYNAPSGMHDDCVIALALAWEAGGGARWYMS